MRFRMMISVAEQGTEPKCQYLSGCNLCFCSKWWAMSWCKPTQSHLKIQVTQWVKQTVKRSQVDNQLTSKCSLCHRCIRTDEIYIRMCALWFRLPVRTPNRSRMICMDNIWLSAKSTDWQCSRAHRRTIWNAIDENPVEHIAIWSIFIGKYVPDNENCMWLCTIRTKCGRVCWGNDGFAFHSELHRTHSICNATMGPIAS